MRTGVPVTATWSYPTAIRFGVGRVVEIVDACEAVGIARPLVVTDPGLVDLPVLATVRNALDSAGVAHDVFSDLRPNPLGSDVDRGVAAFRAGGHDGVIAVGGGSALDVGKLVAFMAGQTRPLWDFEDVGDRWTRADAHAIAPVVAVPTTAGTGSEVGRAGVVIHEAEGRKFVAFHPGMLAKTVIVDPELTVDLPAHLTVGTGIDAFSHCLEALCAPGYHPMSDGIAVEGCRLVIENLPRVVADPGDLAARGHMMSAAAMGAVAFQKGLGAIHALSHPVSVRWRTHHGMTNAVLMPYVLEANLDHIVAPLTRLAAYAGIDGGPTGLLDHVLGWRATLGVPHTLVDLGADPAAVDDVAADALREPPALGNPRPLTHELAAAIYGAACAGTLTTRSTSGGR
jgi:alcohol dehydrogenase